MSQAGAGADEPRVKFWSDPYGWPIDSSKHVFLARSVHEVGRALYPGTWTGDEPVTPWEPPLTADFDSSISAAQLERAQLLLYRRHEGYRARITNPIFLPIPSPEEWSFALAQSVSEHDKNWPMFNRFYSVIRTLSSLFEAGMLSTGIRDNAGGAVYSLHPSYWNGESVVSRFDCYQIQPAQPFSWQIIERDGLWIYVERESLDYYLSLQRPALPKPAQSSGHTEIFEHLSEYVRFIMTGTPPALPGRQ